MANFFMHSSESGKLCAASAVNVKTEIGKQIICFSAVYQIFFVILSLRFSKLQLSVDSYFVLSFTILTVLILLIIVSRDLILLRCLFFHLLTYSLTESR